MKVSVVITVLNESSSIAALIESLVGQKLKPDEIIIVDGGSTDQTISIIYDYVKKYRFIHFIFDPGNIAHGRNVGIRYSKNEIIAITDAGCVAKHDWLEQLIRPFNETSTYVVAGYYKMLGTSKIQRTMALFLGVTQLQFNPSTYIPSARSMAFKKKVWEDLGGFEEKLTLTGEDTLFNYVLIKKGYKFVIAHKAIVSWEVPKNFSDSISKFFNYAKGDAQTGIWWNPVLKFKTHNLKILTIYIRYMIFLGIYLLFLNSLFTLYPFLFTVCLYVFWVVYKMRKSINSLSALLLIVFIQITSDIAVMLGFLSGLILQPKKYSK